MYPRPVTLRGSNTVFKSGFRDRLGGNNLEGLEKRVRPCPRVSGYTLVHSAFDKDFGC